VGAAQRPVWLTALAAFENVVGVVLFGMLVALVLIGVLVRFFLYRWTHMAWADEIARALLLWTSLWGAAIVQREDRHIVIELLYDRFPRPVQRFLRIMSDLLVTALLLILVSQGWPLFRDSFVRQAPASGLPSVIFDGALWVTCLLMVLHTAINAATAWRARDR
jgi:C4-dicarboxylate transporter DctQ subunit